MNGVGVGHVARTITLIEAVRSEWKVPDKPIQVFALTTSEAPSMFFDNHIPFFKLPSPIVMTDAGVSRSAYDAVGRSITCEILRRVDPDLLVVDTLPSGLFGELAPTCSDELIGCCRRRVLIARPVRQEVTERPTYGPALRQYDRIIVPESKSEKSLNFGNVSTDRVLFCGPIVSLAQNTSTQAFRNLRGDIDPRKLLILLSVGGGGHSDAQDIIEFVSRSLALDQDVHLVGMLGPLYRGSVPHPMDNATWIRGERTAPLLSQVDIAISTAGYNSFNELMFHRIPTIFIPVSAKLDDQHARAERATREGAAQVLSSLNVNQLCEFIASWKDPILRHRASRATSRVVPTNGATAAARELISLLDSGTST